MKKGDFRAKEKKCGKKGSFWGCRGRNRIKTVICVKTGNSGIDNLKKEVKNSDLRLKLWFVGLCGKTYLISHGFGSEKNGIRYINFGAKREKKIKINNLRLKKRNK